MLDFDWDSEEVALDASFLESVRLSRLTFADRLCQRSQTTDPKVLEQLRSEAVYQIAEFLYSMKAYGIESVDHLNRFAELHNDYIVSLTRDRPKLERLGLSDERALAAMFTADTKPRLLQTWIDRPGAIDQSNLARFLVTVMSTETCRKVIIDLAKAGFLVREKSPFGSMLVWSAGTMEIIFADVLRQLRLRVQNGANPSVPAA
jgi:hypothetical protein